MMKTLSSKTSGGWFVLDGSGHIGAGPFTSESAAEQYITSACETVEHIYLDSDEQALVDKEVQMIANELRIWLSDDERRQIRCTPKANLARFNSSLGRDIRNEYDLWLEDHHITKIWHEAKRANGVENHPCHPDNFSAMCIERLWELLQSKGTV